MTDDVSEERKKLIYRARLSEHCERYEDMVEDMKSVALNFSPMDVEERNLMSVGYKNVVGQRRTALRTFKYLREHQSNTQIEEYITRVEKELDERCNEIHQVRSYWLWYWETLLSLLWSSIGCTLKLTNSLIIQKLKMYFYKVLFLSF